MRFTSLVAFTTLYTLAAAWDITSTVTVTTQSPAPTTISQCNTGDAQCCDSTLDQNNVVATTLLGLLGVVVSGVDALLGVSCSPVSLISDIDTYNILIAGLDHCHRNWLWCFLQPATRLLREQQLQRCCCRRYDT